LYDRRGSEKGDKMWKTTNDLPSSNDQDDKNVEKIRTLVRTDCRFDIRIISEELHVKKEMVRQISTTNYNTKGVCACERDHKESG
jgi:hypothetical protein